MFRQGAVKKQRLKSFSFCDQLFLIQKTTAMRKSETVLFADLQE